MLAFEMTEEGEYREFCLEELKAEATVPELFKLCKKAKAYITDRGWSFLVSHYGYEALFELDRNSGWLGGDSPEEFIRNLEYERNIAIASANDQCGIVW